MFVINAVDLGVYLGDADLDVGRAQLMVQLTNGLVSEVTGELDPVPTRVFGLALEVAARAYRNPTGAESETESVDDYSHTTRYSQSPEYAGVYLTEAEAARLRGKSAARQTVASMRVRVPGYTAGP